MASQFASLLKFVQLTVLLAVISTVAWYSHNPPLFINSKGYGEGSMNCSEAITDTLMTLDDIVAAYFVLSTGKYLDNWGAYGSCIDSVTGGTYWLVTVTGTANGTTTDKSPVTFYTGLWVPKDCTMNDMVQLNNLFIGAAEFNNVTNPVVKYDSVTDFVESQQGSFKTGEVIVWLFIILFIGASGIGTLIHITKLFDKSIIKEKSNRAAEGADQNGEYSDIRNDDMIDPKTLEHEFGNNIATLYRKRTIALAFLPFSLIRNAIKLVTPQRNAQIHPQNITDDEKTMSLMDGMKFYAMLWIIYANTLAYTEVGVIENAKDKPQFFKDFLFTLFPTAYFASDVFFFLSGFIAIFTMLKLKNFNILVMLNQIVRRAYRIIPIIAFVMFTARYVIPRFVEGPLCQRYTEQFEGWDKYFWTNLLLINNLYPVNLSSGCMPWTWFFSCEFQLFLFVPIIAMVAKKSKLFGYIVPIVLVVMDIILMSVLNGVASHPGANPYLDTAYFTDLYIKPWSRSIPYYLGVFFGTVFYNYVKNPDDSFMLNKIKYNPLLRAAMYVLGFSLMFVMVFSVYDYTKDYGTGWSTGARVAYATLSTPLFILGLVLIIIPALLNRAKLVRFLLIGPVLTLLARSTYIVALSHPVLMIGIYVTTGQAIYMETYKMFAMFWGHAFLSYAIGINLFILIEGPIRGMESIWSESFYAVNMVDNWIATQKYEKKQSKDIDQDETSDQMKKARMEETKGD